MFTKSGSSTLKSIYSADMVETIWPGVDSRVPTIGKIDLLKYF